MKSIRILFAAGGSAGHINPALATADALREIDDRCEISFASSGRELETRLIAAAGYYLAPIPAMGFTRGISFRSLKRNMTALSVNRKAAYLARELLAEIKPDIVVGTGGFACYYVLREAAAKGIKTVVHASDAVPGLAIRKLARHMTRMYTAFPESVQYYERAQDIKVAPTPVRRGFSTYTREEARIELGIPGNTRLVLSYYGSLGAESMNESIKKLIEINAENPKFMLIHAVGGTDERFSKFKQNLSYGSETVVRKYIDDMPRVMAAADIILSRAGANTLAELTLLGRASILIPSPYVPNDHQTKNADAMEKAGASIMLRETEATGERLRDLIVGLPAQKINDMAAAARALGAEDSAAKFALELLEMVR